MQDLTYKRLCSEDDADIPKLRSAYKAPEVARYICIGDNYFHYVTHSENVCFYKVYEGKRLIGAVHLEKQGDVLFMDILVLRGFQKMGFGARILGDMQDDVFMLGYKSIEVFIDETNHASLRLFQNAGFVFASKEKRLIHFIYKREK